MYSGFNYIHHNKYARHKAKETLGYNETRKGKDDEAIERNLFGNSGPLTREQAEWLITTASRDTYFFRWILSPDLQEENGGKDLDLWQLARDGVRWLEERLQREGEIQLIGAEHNDHTGIPHIHAILLIERRGRELILNKADINAFRERVHALALAQRQARQKAQLEEAREAKQEARQRRAGAAAAAPGGRRVHFQPEQLVEPTYRAMVPPCAFCTGSAWQRLIEQGHDRCPRCGRVITRRQEAVLSR